MSRPRLLLAVQTVLVVAILAVCVGLAMRHDVRWDLTPEQTFTLSPHARAVLDRLTVPVEVTAFYSNEDTPGRHELTQLVELFRDASPQLTVRLLDLDRSPGAAERLGAGGYDTAVVEATRDGTPRRERVQIVTEDTLVAAIARAAGAPDTVTYWVVGHGERDPDDMDGGSGAGEAIRALGLDGFAMRRLDGAARVPDDAGLLVLASPLRTLAPAEVEALTTWVRGGGRLLAFVDPGAPEGVRQLLGGFGIEPANDVVMDAEARLFGVEPLSARIAFLNQQIVPDVPEVGAMLPVVQTLRIADAPGVRADYLAVTGEGTWADVDRRALTGQGEPIFREGTDRPGPLPVAVLARVPRDDAPEGRLVVLGDADFLTNRWLGVLGNRDLLILLAELVVHEAATSAAHRPGPARGMSSIVLTEQEARLVFWTAVAGPALLFALGGLLVARRRRGA